MTKNKLERIKFSDISESSPYIIKNFIATNSEKEKLDVSFDYPFSIDAIVFIICLKGSGKVKINFKEYVMEENSISIILPNQIVEKVNHSDNNFIEVLCCSIDFLSDLPFPTNFELPKRIADNPVLKITPEETQHLLRYHSFIVETFNNTTHIFQEKIIKGLLFSLMMEIGSIYLNQESDMPPSENMSSRNKEIVKQFMELLKDHFKIGRTASYYADKMFISPKYLSAVLKKETGSAINAWIERATIMGAKMLLKSTNLTVLQISEELNFPNPSYFGRFFKKSTGVTPKYYREKV